MNRQELAERRNFDFRVLRDMRCESFDFEAYRTVEDLRQRRRMVTTPEEAATATKYRWIFRIRTHVSEESFAQQTEIGVNTDVSDYPLKPPGTWIISDRAPWSPHFMKNAPVCIGWELWEPTEGHVTLGDLVIHIAHLLNWDEIGRGPGYVGWNRDAIIFHRKIYNGGPIDPSLQYPALPSWLSGDGNADAPAFQIVRSDGLPASSFRVRR
jgi:hypothetical protein